jgi:NAD(P)-dependent dehydrogenase (short-subunit alcohol dehydrogenase family)
MSKVWFVTGSSRGLGLEIARAALAAGDRVVATARNPADLRDLVGAYPEHARAMALDVTDPRAARAAVEATVSAFGRIDVVVNNAGYGNVCSIEDVTDEDFRAQLETNFFGVVNVTRTALPVLRKQRDGHFLQISSIGGRWGSPGLAAYQSSKWALEGFSEVLSLETRPLGIRVTIVEPGGFRTDWAGASMRIDPVQSDYEETVAAFSRNVRQHLAHGDPAKAARAILKVAEMRDPPRRLLLGTDALFLARAVSAERTAEDEKWKALTASTDADGVGDFADTPIAKMLGAARS